MKTLEDICRVRVKFSEIDSMRRVWHGEFVKYMEDGRESFGRHFPGIGYADMQKAGIYAPVYDLHVRYLAPLAINDIAVIRTTFVYHPGARLDFAYKIYKASGDEPYAESNDVLCAEGETTQLFIDSSGELLTDLPPYFIDWQKKYLGI
ncbi:MAG: acyl-CoA thioesterase [Prevotella sp.]|nr:acyl-CoA thioesterase [Prevotella sp.]